MRRLAAPAIALLLAALAPIVTLPSVNPAAAATSRPNPKVVVIAGPVGSSNAHYQSDADAIAATARKYTSNVVEIKSPHATWSRVKPALQGASIVVYLGHGNGWPSIYAPYQPYTKDGFGLDPETGANGETHEYIGEYYIARDVKLAPNAVVLFHHLCYASGNTEPGLAVGPLSSSMLRPDNYAAGFITAGARAVIADVAHPHTGYIDWLFTRKMSIQNLFYTYPTYHGHPLLMDSIRHPGFKEILDPTTTSGPFYRSIVYNPSLTTQAVTGAWYAPTTTAPSRLTAPGAAEVTAETPWFADAALTPDPTTGAPAGTLAIGTRIRLTAAAPDLADGTKVFAFTTLDGATSGFVAGTSLAPRDSEDPKLWTFDGPISPVSVDGTHPFEMSFRASEKLGVRVSIANDAGDVVRTIATTDDWTTLTWDLKTADGKVIPNGTYTYAFTGSDGWGNVPVTRTGTFTVDVTDPVSTATVSAGTLGAAGWYTTAASVAVSATDTGTGVRARTYAVDGGTAKTVSGPVVLATSGAHKVTYYATDRAGNREPSHSLTVKVDVTKPVTRAVATGTAGTSGWWNGPVSVALQPIDADSGVASLTASADGAPSAPVTAPFTFTTEGTHTLTYGATDKAGNVEATKTTTIKIDSTKPSTNAATVTGTLGGDGWLISPATVSFTGTDALSGVAGFRISLDSGAAKVVVASTVVSTAGNHTLTYAAVDRAGNVDATKTAGFKIDNLPPVSTATLVGQAGDAGFYRGDVTATVGAVDTHSGVASQVASVDGAPFAAVTGPIGVTADGAHTIRFAATDKAGNVEQTRSVSFAIDRTAPSLGSSLPAPTPLTFSPNGDGTSDTVAINQAVNEPATIAVQVTNAGGTIVRSFSKAVTGAGPIAWDGKSDAGTAVADGTYTVTLTPRDRAGNVGAPLATTVDVYSAFVGGTRSSALFFPQDGDSVAKNMSVSFTLRAAATVRLEVIDANRTVVRTVESAKAAGAAAVSWDGRTDAGTFAPQGLYTLRVTATDGTRFESKRFSVRAQAFLIATSASSLRRGHSITVTVTSAEPLSTTPHVSVKQPGRAAYSVTMRKISSNRWRVTFTVRSSSTGTASLNVGARDRAGHWQSSLLRLPVR